jgi:Fe-S cluster assembly protein SufD
MNAALTSRLAEDYAASAPGRATAVAPARRQHAIEVLSAAGLPSTRDENWKYANLRPLERLRFLPAAPAAVTAAQLPPPVSGFARQVFVDGRFAAALSAPAAADSVFGSLSNCAAAAHALTAEERATDQRFALLNEAFATDGARIQVRADQPGHRLELVFVASAEAASGSSYPRLEVQLQAGASLELLERHVSAQAAASFVNSAVRIELERGATLKHYRLQGLSGGSILFDTLNASLAQDAAYRLHAVSTGAQSARSTQRIRLIGERADLRMAIAALADAQQVQDSFALVEHRAPRARTEQLFRGIAAGRSRVGFNGKIVVAPGAAGTDSKQSLRGLLAGPGAEIDVRPQLEIYTDDVRCSHGATAGKLDDNMLFYLRSRGLEPDTARRLLKWAFLADAFASIEVPQLRQQIEQNLAGVLQDATLKELL